MSVEVQYLSRRTKTLCPAQTESDSEPRDKVRSEKFIDFKPIIFNKSISTDSSQDVDKLDEIVHRKYNKYSVTGIKELPLSGGITEDEIIEDNEESIENGRKVNGQCANSDTDTETSLSTQLGTKERELQVALQKQERYQSTVQDVTARMERVQHKLAALGTSPFKNLEQQLSEQKVRVDISFEYKATI